VRSNKDAAGRQGFGHEFLVKVRCWRCAKSDVDPKTTSSSENNKESLTSEPKTLAGGRTFLRRILRKTGLIGSAWDRSHVGT